MSLSGKFFSGSTDRGFQSVPGSLTDTSDGFFVCVCVHSQGDGCVAVPQPLGYADNVPAVGDGDRDGCVAEQVRMKAGDVVLVAELFLK